MKYFITGGSGFIGTSLTEFLLLDPQASITSFDIAKPKQEFPERFTYAPGDILNADALRQAMRGHDAVIHLAANADIAAGARDTAIDLELTTIATHHVLESMRLTGVSRIVYLSGSGVYGDLGQVTLHENLGPLLPVSFYGASKLAAEGLVSAFSHMFGIHATIFRPANIVGKHQTHGVIFDFIRKLRANDKWLEILGDGSQTKSYIHISNVLAAISQMLSKPHSSALEVYNISSDDQVDVNWIAQCVITTMKLPSVTVSHTGGRIGWKGDVPLCKIDSSKLKKTGWTCTFNSREAVQKTVEEILASD